MLIQTPDSALKQYGPPKIKILYIITSLGVGGAEKILLATIKKLDRNQFSPYVLSLYQEDTLLTEFRKSCDGIYSLKYSRKYNPFIIRKIIKLIKEIQPEIVHTHLPHATIWGRIAAYFTSVKVIITTEHNISIWKRRNIFFYFLYRLTTRFTNRIIAVSQAIMQKMINVFHIPAAKIEIIYNGINLDEILNNSRPPPDLSMLSHPIIGTVGRLHKLKGHETLIKSMTVVRKHFPQANLIIVGDGEEKTKLEKLTKKLKLEEYAYFLGIRNDLPRLLNLMDIFVFPSIEEGLGIALIEACAAGKPCIASNVGGIPEIIEDGKNGFLVIPLDPSALAQKIIKLINCQKMWQIMGDHGKRIVKQKFILEQKTRQLEYLYTGIITEGGKYN